MNFDYIELKAPAKINLSLVIKGKRPDGYHNLETVMVKVDLNDRVWLKAVERKGITFRCRAGKKNGLTYQVPCDETNLVYQAAEAFFSQFSSESGIELVLEKNIPVAAGLGGGSSDAAAVLLGMRALFCPNVVEEDLLSLAGKLGADVPFFVQNAEMVFAQERGDCFQGLPGLGECRVLLVNPGISVATKWAYDNFALTSEENTYTLAPDFVKKKSASWYRNLKHHVWPLSSDLLVNDLERVTEKQYPVITEIKKVMMDEGADCSLMSGSGPTVFALFSDYQKAQDCFSLVQKNYHESFLCKPYIANEITLSKEF